MLTQFDPAILQAVERASRRSSAVAHEDLKAGLYDLATIASTAPWFGIFGTIVGIVNSFQGFSGQRWSVVAAIYGGFSRAIWFTALGLLVGLMALWAYEYLSTRLQTLDLEMENASRELLNQLGRFPRRFQIGPEAEPSLRPMFAELPAESVQREEKFFRRCLIVAALALAVACLVQAVRFVPGYDSPYSYSSAILYACFYVPITFAISCFFVYPFWSKFLHRRPGALMAIGSVVSLCWSVAEFVLGRPLP